MSPGPATVAQRIFSKLIDAGIVLLASLVFFAAFLVCVRHLPASRWAWPVALVAPFVFWASYLYLFLAHPRGTRGMQMAASGAPASKPEMFDLVPPSPLVAASSRILTWLEAHSAGAPRADVDAPAMATSQSHVTPPAAEPAHPGNGMSQCLNRSTAPNYQSLCPACISHVGILIPYSLDEGLWLVQRVTLVNHKGDLGAKNSEY